MNKAAKLNQQKLSTVLQAVEFYHGW